MRVLPLQLRLSGRSEKATDDGLERLEQRDAQELYANRRARQVRKSPKSPQRHARHDRRRLRGLKDAEKREPLSSRVSYATASVAADAKRGQAIGFTMDH